MLPFPHLCWKEQDGQADLALSITLSALRDKLGVPYLLAAGKLIQSPILKLLLAGGLHPLPQRGLTTKGP